MWRGSVWGWRAQDLRWWRPLSRGSRDTHLQSPVSTQTQACLAYTTASQDLPHAAEAFTKFPAGGYTISAFIKAGQECFDRNNENGKLFLKCRLIINIWMFSAEFKLQNIGPCGNNAHYSSRFFINENENICFLDSTWLENMLLRTQERSL